MLISFHRIDEDARDPIDTVFVNLWKFVSNFPVAHTNHQPTLLLPVIHQIWQWEDIAKNIFSCLHSNFSKLLDCVLNTELVLNTRLRFNTVKFQIWFSITLYLIKDLSSQYNEFLSSTKFLYLCSTISVQCSVNSTYCLFMSLIN